MRYIFKLSVTLETMGESEDKASVSKECVVIFAEDVLPKGGESVENAISELLCRMSEGSGIAIQ